MEYDVLVCQSGEKYVKRLWWEGCMAGVFGWVCAVG